MAENVDHREQIRSIFDPTFLVRYEICYVEIYFLSQARGDIISCMSELFSFTYLPASFPRDYRFGPLVLMITKFNSIIFNAHYRVKLTLPGPSSGTYKSAFYGSLEGH